jgi:hypothetical protein
MSFRFPRPSLPLLLAGPFKKSLVAVSPAWLACLLLAAAGSARAEDPFIGQIRAIKCVNCKPGWVTLIVHDPIEMREIELHLKDTEYNKIIAPLPGKRIYEGEGQCFYWMEKPKMPKDASAKGVDKPVGKTMSDKEKPAEETAAAGEVEEGSHVPPPSEEVEGTPSRCIPFHRQSN